MIYAVILLILVGVVVYIRYKNRYISQSPWQHFYDNCQFSTQDFYNQVVEGIKERQIPNLDIDRELFFETHIASARREYLKITRDEYVFYICSAPFGTGTFVSNWMCIKRETAINTVPIINTLLGKNRHDKTFYQLDTETMYRSSIHSIVVKVLDEITATKGVRGLTELEKQYSVGK